MRYLIAFALLITLHLTIAAQNSTEKPFQIQLNLSGLVLNGLAEDLSRRDVISLEVKEYEMPGLSIGYHLSSKFYLGYSYHPNRNYILQEAYSFEGGPDDVLITLDHKTGTFHSLEGRLTPFGFGLYAAAFFTHVSEARYNLTGVPIGESFEISGNLYEDAVSAEWNFKDMTTFGLGLGYNHVFGNGLSFNVGAGLPMRFAKDIYDDVQVIQQDNEFDQDDIQVIQERLQEEDFYFPVQFYANVGWNF